MLTWAYLISVVVAIAINKIIKLILAIAHKEKITMAVLVRSGDMPSDHSAAVSSVVTTIGLLNGLKSPVFGLGLCLALIVMYDAMNVRLSTGEQGLALNQLLKRHRKKLLDVPQGHEPLEVVMGAVVGLVASFMTFWFFF